MNISNNFNLLRNLKGDEVYPKELINVLKKHTKKDVDGFVKVNKNGKVIVNKEAVVNELMKNPSKLATFIKYIKTEGNERLLNKISADLYKMDPNKPGFKKLETCLRNRGLLNQTTQPDFEMKDEKGNVEMKGHKSILALESPYFKALQNFQNLQGKTGKETVMEMRIPKDAYKLVMDYLYSSDVEREKLLTKLDKGLLVDIAKLADLWQVDKALTTRCDAELCKALLGGELGIEKDGLEQWEKLSHILPKFANLVKFIIREGGELDPMVGSFLNDKIAKLDGFINIMSSEGVKGLIANGNDEEKIALLDQLNMKEKDMEEMGIPQESYKIVMDYLYSSDAEREKLLTTVDKGLLVNIAKLANLWQINKALTTRCDEELCRALLGGELGIGKGDLEKWEKLSVILPKFTSLAKFIIREGGELDPIVSSFLKIKIEQLNRFINLMTSAGVKGWLSNTGDDRLKIALLAQLNPATEFGKASQSFHDTFVHKMSLNKASEFMESRPKGDYMIIKQPDNSLYLVAKDANGQIQSEKLTFSLKHKGRNLIDKDSVKYQMAFTDEQALRFVSRIPHNSFFIHPSEDEPGSFFITRNVGQSTKRDKCTKASEDPGTPWYLETITKPTGWDCSEESIIKHFTDKGLQFLGPDSLEFLIFSLEG